MLTPPHHVQPDPQCPDKPGLVIRGCPCVTKSPYNCSATKRLLVMATPLTAANLRPALLYTLEQSPSRGVVLAEVLAWLRFPAVHANVQGGIEYFEARLCPRMPGFFIGAFAT